MQEDAVSEQFPNIAHVFLFPRSSYKKGNEELRHQGHGQGKPHCRFVHAHRLSVRAPVGGVTVKGSLEKSAA